MQDMGGVGCEAKVWEQLGGWVGSRYLPYSTLNGNGCQDVCAVEVGWQIKTSSY